jgi:ribonuclease HI
VYADGACSGNPGPAGLGISSTDGAELSEYLGSATNNVAELTAVLRVAEKYADDPRPIEIRTDSQYAIGVLTKGWKAKANTELVAQVKKALARMGDVHLTYVPGHSGVAGNERADELARAAIVARASSGWVSAKK